jgi:ribosomal-protein-serine acetyltransferase
MPGDGKVIFEAVEESRASFRRWLPWIDSTQSWKDSERSVCQFYSEFILRKSLILGIFQDDRVIGMGGFKEINWRIPSAPIGYWFRVSEQRKGLIREAMTALIDYGFRIMDLKRLTILCDDDNIGSIRVAEQLGFHLETRAQVIIENLRGDDLVWGRRYVRFGENNPCKNKSNL